MKRHHLKKKTSAILFSFSLIFCPALAWGSPQVCDGLLKKPSYWLLPPKIQQLVIGMLVQTTTGQKLLSVTDYYWGSHENIYKHLQKHHPIQRILWSGEMLIENPEDQMAQGLVVLSINTSGYAAERVHRPGSTDVNEPRHLRDSIEKYRPDMHTEFSQYFSYSAEHAHLDPLFQDLHDRTRYSQQDTVRHRFRTILSILVSLSHYLTKTRSATWQEELKQINQLSSETMNDIIQFFESQSQFTGKSPASREKGPRRLFSGLNLVS